MTSCERYDHATHYGLLSGWFQRRGMAPDAGLPSAYPPTGFVVDGIVAGFVYLTNAPAVAFLDNVVSDPEADRARRADALSALASELCAEGDRHGVTSLWVFPRFETIVEHCKKQGFVEHPGQYKALVRNRCQL